MNTTMLQKNAFTENLVINVVIIFLGFTINSINGVFVFVFFKSSVFYNDPRYILYIHLVINDMLMVFISVVLFVMSYAWPNVPLPFCVVLLMMASATHKNTPLTLAGMAVERYIAVCKPLHHAQICTVRRTYILIYLIWGVGVLPTFSDFVVLLIFRPLSIFDSSVLCSSANLYNTPYHADQSKATHGIYFSTVWLILLYTYCKVLVTARRATTEKSSAKKAQNTILLHGLQLLLCMLSFITPVIDKVYASLLEQKRNIYFVNYLLTNILPRLLTPLIYGIRDQLFYNHLKGLFSFKLFILNVTSDER